MACNCGANHCPECMGGWTPQPEPEEGTPAWKNDMAISYIIEKKLMGDKSIIVKLPKCKGHDLGYMAIQKHFGGHDYFRVDSIQGD